MFIDNDGVRHSIVREYSSQGELVGTYRIMPLPWSQDMVGVIAIQCT
ncbi:hypothetical protein [Paraburkholderia sp.]|nr:hypothetical protein [Paraburkholderia sp.]